jgi:hypothetical protein
MTGANLNVETNGQNFVNLSIFRDATGPKLRTIYVCSDSD